MRTNAFIIFIFLTASSRVYAQVPMKNIPVNVKFELYSPVLPDTSHVYITGSIEDLGSWDPGKIPMAHTGKHRWQKSITVIRPVSLEYKYTLGSWDTEAADANGNPLQNFTLNVVTDTAARDNIMYWKNGRGRKVIHGQITGRVKYIHHIEGVGLLPRDVIVWLPPGYRKNKKERYPVLYMQDGQNIIDPATSAFGTDWQVDEACDSLIRNHLMEPLIVVGIYNTADRSLEYTPGDTGDQYMKFLVTRLKPLIDDSFRTLPDQPHTFVGGSSAGALISFMLAWQYPDVFSDAICFSPAFKIFRIDYVNYVNQTRNAPEGVFFYIYNGGKGLDADLQTGVDYMLTALERKGFHRGKDFYYINSENGRHTEADWAKQFPEAIIKCFESH